MQQFPKRKSIRLSEYDYSQPGYYFITICTHQRQNLFGQIIEGKMYLNELGKIIGNQWHNIPKRFDNVQIEKFVIMPNHFHGIIHVRRGAVSAPVRKNNVQRTGGGTPPLRPVLLGNVIAYFKYNAAKQINLIRQTPGQPVWQRNYYETVIADNNAYAAIWEYIDHNPDKWLVDKNYKL